MQKLQIPGTRTGDEMINVRIICQKLMRAESGAIGFHASCESTTFTPTWLPEATSPHELFLAAALAPSVEAVDHLQRTTSHSRRKWRLTTLVLR
ncbi:Hypothetical protein NTJ_04243 [Nesidiocoris tenuis]|uniref:Uncharacterized protein n=1 Tax=Nesidiocoris tenuis TaxID=355587 RepID=A0ABN7AGP5_9HEMI|nr:Hypothetical protein NTJ_04243 [Nesidiocoris tenuis]